MVCSDIESLPEAEYKRYRQFRSTPNERWQSVPVNDKVWAGGNTLILLNISQLNNGQYRCRGRNEVARSELSVDHSLWKIRVDNTALPISGDVQVIEDPLPSEPSEILVQKGGSATLKCFFFGHPEVKIAWSIASGRHCQGNDIPSHEFRPIQEDDGRIFKHGILLLLGNLQQRHQGCYQCEAKANFQPGKYAKAMYVRVTDPSTVSIINPGDDNRQFRCIVSGQPYSSVRWFLNHTEFSEESHIHWALSTDGMELSVTNPTLRVPGVISCRVDWDDTSVIASVPLRLSLGLRQPTASQEENASYHIMYRPMHPIPARLSKSQLSLKQGNPPLTTSATSGTVLQLILIVSIICVVITTAAAAIFLTVRRIQRHILSHTDHQKHYALQEMDEDYGVSL